MYIDVGSYLFISLQAMDVPHKRLQERDYVYIEGNEQVGDPHTQIVVEKTAGCGAISPFNPEFKQGRHSSSTQQHFDCISQRGAIRPSAL